MGDRRYDELHAVFDAIKGEDNQISYKAWMRGMNKHAATLNKFLGGENAADLGRIFKGLAKGGTSLSWANLEAGARAHAVAGTPEGEILALKKELAEAHKAIASNKKERELALAALKVCKNTFMY